MKQQDITASRHFRNKNWNKEASFFVERDSESGANLIIEFSDNFEDKHFKITNISLEALKELAVMFDAASKEEFLEGVKYIESEDNMVSPTLTKIKD